ncbi:restriction endonuclease subunit S [Bifidobacterium longum]|nr:restriction endonuclease subunit S [Bifidobacterium longum]KAB6781936.1 restriction endonuclease subunit S [Bifidobacterium longum]KAB6784791.1 restriction endonuclease subunit S [Bifidobacterium longum]KAB6787391.1 restriction endonuclease subunit S [Bifidobacterium longum]KAB6790118.1 restriction endonuclease subunit S [Bifidobacterium longum]
MTEQAKVPAIRFAGFTDPWEQRKLENLASFGGGHTPSMADASNYVDGKILWVTSQDVKQHYIENTTTMISEKGAATLTLYPSDSIVIVARSGILRHTIPVAKLRKPATVNQDIKVIQTVDSCDSSWLLQYFIASNKTLLREYGKTGTTVESIDFAKMKSTALMVPYIEEQQAIGSFFSRLDNLITLHQRKYDKLVIFKKSMLEKMFPKDGESVPEIRFAGFTDPWEQRKLGEIVSIGAGAPPSAFSAGNFLYVKVDDLNESSHFQFDSAQRVDANTAVKPIRKGSIIFAKRGAAILGNKVRVLGKTAYIDTNMMALEPRGVDADFLWLFINQTGLYRIADTSTIPQINNKHIEPYPVDIPNMAEQQAIGTFFSRLDDLITLHQRKLELLQDIKKSLLDKMFV